MASKFEAAAHNFFDYRWLKQKTEKENVSRVYHLAWLCTLYCNGRVVYLEFSQNPFRHASLNALKKLLLVDSGFHIHLYQNCNIDASIAKWWKANTERVSEPNKNKVIQIRSQTDAARKKVVFW